MLFWSRIVERRRALKRLTQAVSEALEAREGAIAGQLHRADHMRAKGRCAYCVEEARREERLKRLAS